MTQSLAPTFHGYILSNEDALLVIEAALAGKFPLVQRRPLDSERPELIRSGNVFVFIEEASDIKRWTDGVAWSASRILGRFLIYRRLDKHGLLSKDDKRRAKNQARRKGSRDEERRPSVPSSLNSANSANSINSGISENTHYDNIDPLHDHYAPYGGDVSRPVTPGTPVPVVHDRGLIKKTLSLTVPASESDTGSPKTIHLISYFCAHDVLAGNLVRPSQTELSGSAVAPALWSAIKRSSLGGKLLSEAEANFYLDSNYQLQNMASEAPQHVLHHDPRARRFSSVYPMGSAPINALGGPMSGPMSAPISGLTGPMSAPINGPNGPISGPLGGINTMATMARPPFRTQLSAPLTAPVRSPSMAPKNDPYFFPENGHSYTPGHEPDLVRKMSYDEQPRKRSRSLQAENVVPTEPWSDDPRKQPEMPQSYVPQSLHHPNFGNFGTAIRDLRPEYPYSSWDHGAEIRGPVHHVTEEANGYEQYSTPALNNRAFGLQMSQHRPYVFNNLPQHPYLPQQRWDGLPAPMAVARLDAPSEEIEYDHHEIYE